VTPIAPNPTTPIGHQPIITNQTFIKTQDGQMLIPIQVPQQGNTAQGQTQTQIGPKPTHQTGQFVATSSSHGHITTSHPTTVPIQTTPVPKQKPGPSGQISKLVSSRRPTIIEKKTVFLATTTKKSEDGID